MTKKKIWLAVASAVLVALAVTGTVHIVRAAQRRETERERQRLAQAYYDEKLATYEVENETGEPVDVVFLGDSLTDGCDLAKYYPAYRCLNRGIGGDTTDGLLKRLDVSLFQVDCRAVVLLIGANNIHTMLDNYEDILRLISENKPDIPVVVLSLSAMGLDWAKNNAEAIENNKTVRALAEKYGYTFVDIFTPLLDSETGEIVPAYTTDGGHWTHEGYTVVSGLVNEKLGELLQN